MTKAKVETTAVDLASLAIEDVFIHLLDVAPWNARKTFDPAALNELTESIKAHGIQVPLLARPKVAGRLEIVAGHRRFMVAKALEKKTAPCIVREMTDDQAREIGLVDNLQREDVPALEEADAYAELLERLGNAHAIALRVGKEASYVARRLQLVSLAEMPRKALGERLITIDHALLLARLGVDEQNANLKWALNTNAGIKVPVERVIEERISDLKRGGRWKWEPQSPQRLKEHIEEHVGRKLSRAPWKLDDAALLPEAGACSSCPQNTKANDTLFGDLNIQAATCENGGCFEKKRAAFVQIRIKELGAGTPEEILRLSWKATTTEPRMEIDQVIPVPGAGINSITKKVKLTQIFKDGQWVEAKKGSCPNILSGVTIDWSDANDRGYMGGGEKLRKPGQMLTVCVAAKCKAHKKSWERSKGDSANGRHDAKAEEAAREKRRQAAIAESKIRMAVATKAIEGVKALPMEALRVLALAAAPNWGDREKAVNALMPGFKKTLQSGKADSLDFAKAVAIVSLDALCAHEHNAEYDRKDFLASVKRLGYDGAKAWDKPAEPKAAKKTAAKPVAKKPAKKAAKKKGGRK